MKRSAIVALGLVAASCGPISVVSPPPVPTPRVAPTPAPRMAAMDVRRAPSDTRALASPSPPPTPYVIDAGSVVGFDGTTSEDSPIALEWYARSPGESDFKLISTEPAIKVRFGGIGDYRIRLVARYAHEEPPGFPYFNGTAVTIRSVALFVDGFETGDARRWSAAVGLGAHVSTPFRRSPGRLEARSNLERGKP